MRWPLYFVSNKIKNSLHRVSLMPLDGCRRFGAIEFERHDNHEKTIQLYPGTVRVREAFVLRSIEVYPWFNDLVTASFTKNYFLIFISVSQSRSDFFLSLLARCGMFGWRATCFVRLPRVPRRAQNVFRLPRRC